MDSCHRHGIDRRNFLKLLAALSPVVLSGCTIWRLPTETEHSHEHGLEDLAGGSPAPSEPVHTPPGAPDAHSKVVNFDHDFADDIYCTPLEKAMIAGILTKLRAVQKHVGAGHFNLLGMDDFFRGTERAPGIDAITSAEKAFVESLFYRDAKILGFQGDRVFKSLTDEVAKREAIKVPYTGHFLRKGPAFDTYMKIKKDVGDSLILTSGVRALAKQFHLFLEKTTASNHNYSRASRSIAPPGYSFHGLYDFDVGKIGFGASNFTDEFASTKEFQELSRLGYVDIRYKERNDLGVRFEPWHIKI
jgi:D-alanyl-D-alanine carboxypeptidase